MTINKTNEEILEEVRDYIKYTEKKSDSTVKNYTRAIKVFMEFIDKSIFEAERTDFEKWITELNKKYKSATVNKCYIAGIQFLDKRLNKLYGVERFSVEPPRPPKEEKERMILSDEKVEEVIEKAEGMMLPFILCSFDGGMRISETVKLIGKDIDFEKNNIRIRNAKRNKTRNVAMSTRLSNALKQYIEENKIKSTHSLFDYSTKWMSIKTKELFESCNIEYGEENGVTYHSGRHYFVTKMLDAGVSPKVVADLVGDTIGTIMAVYAHSSDKSKQNAIASVLG